MFHGKTAPRPRGNMRKVQVEPSQPDRRRFHNATTPPLPIVTAYGWIVNPLPAFMPWFISTIDAPADRPTRRTRQPRPETPPKSQRPRPRTALDHHTKPILHAPAGHKHNTRHHIDANNCIWTMQISFTVNTKYTPCTKIVYISVQKLSTMYTQYTRTLCIICTPSTNN